MYNTLLEKKASIYDALRKEDDTRSRSDLTHKRIMPGRVGVEMQDPTPSKKQTFLDTLSSKETPTTTSKEKSHLGRNLAIGGVGLGAAGLGAYLWHKSKKKQALQKKAMELINYYY
jgi:hypothetical protein